MWIYSQSTGMLWNDEGEIVAFCYSGHGEGKNNPSMEKIKDVGPIPKGLYHIGEAYNSERVGPIAIPLDPIEHNCHGRDYFRFHGDSRSNPGNASHGCIIANRDRREMIADSDDKILKVIE